jgi:SAM-dependent methyltransferase
MTAWQPDDLEGARRAAWDADDWANGVEHCLAMIHRALPFHAYESVVDFGAGPARLARPLSQRHEATRIYAYEPNEAMWDRSYIRNRPYLGNAPQYHHAYSTLVFQHLDERDALCALADLSRVIYPGGKFRLQFVNGRDAAGPLSHPRDPQTMKWMCNLFGFDVRDIEPDPKYPTWSWLTAINTRGMQ